MQSTLIEDLKEHSATVPAYGIDREFYDEMKRLVRILEAVCLQVCVCVCVCICVCVCVCVMCVCVY